MSAVPVVIAAGAVLISGLSAFALCGRVADQEEAVVRLEGRLGDALASRDPAPGDADLARVSGALAGLEERIARLETAPRREVVPAGDGPARSALEAAARPEDGSLPAGEAAGAKGTAAERAELEELLKLFGSGYDWEGETAELERFYELARKTGLIDEKVAELESAVESNPEDLELRMELSDTYVAKLMTVQGPEMGMWGERAEEQWREVERRDPEHWRANFSLGQNYAYYPDVMGKTDDAIAYLERARAIQERADQGAEHVRTYLSLARLYQRKGDLERARSLLHAGLRHHPGNAELASALDGLEH